MAVSAKLKMIAPLWTKNKLSNLKFLFITIKKITLPENKENATPLLW